MEKQANSNFFPRWNIHNASWRFCDYWTCYYQVSWLIRYINCIISFFHSFHFSCGSDCYYNSSNQNTLSTHLWKMSNKGTNDQQYYSLQSFSPLCFQTTTAFPKELWNSFIALVWCLSLQSRELCCFSFVFSATHTVSYLQIQPFPLPTKNHLWASNSRDVDPRPAILIVL